MEVRLASVVAQGRWRSPVVFDARGPEGVLVPGHRRVVSFASNDYLGLTTHPSVVEAAAGALSRWGSGAGGSRLITGSRPVHRELEEALAAWKGAEAAVCFPTGFAANLGVLGVLGSAGTALYSDELNHASIVDGCRLARARVSIYRHRDVAHLEALMAGDRSPAVVVSDTVFSMDGDVAPLDELAEVCRRRGAVLVLDEAHAVLGPELGPEVTDGVMVVRVGTLSKTLGSLGGFVAGPRAVVDLVVNLARPYIFTTALPPADAAAALAALEVVRGDQGRELRDRLARHVERLAPGHPSPIIPVIVGSEAGAVAASATLLDRGLWVPAIRPPTVPEGTSRLRVTLSAAHSPEHVDALIRALHDLPGPGAG
ncbi:MAG: aminotransferase class I/II-fold pyridoxal phosphate-dependent enzyme [Acidimicrobiales bacterium]